MIASKKSLIQPLLESSEGIHLTVYIKNDLDLRKVRAELRLALIKAEAQLASVLGEDERAKFLEPIRTLERDERMLSQMKGNLGLFRTAKLFRIVGLSVPVRPHCVVAWTFHIKPLLRWLQKDRDFLFLNVGDLEATLYRADLNSYHYHDAYVFPECPEPNRSAISPSIVRWVRQRAYGQRPSLFLSGEPLLVKILQSQIKYPTVPIILPVKGQGETEISELIARGREILARMSLDSVREAITDYGQAVEEDLGSHNIHQIAQAAVHGRVRKLIISEADQVPGRLDRVTGKLTIYPKGLREPGDDLLDDLAQVVLLKGGEVILSPNSIEAQRRFPVRAIFRRATATTSMNESRGNPWKFASKI